MDTQTCFRHNEKIQPRQTGSIFIETMLKMSSSEFRLTIAQNKKASASKSLISLVSLEMFA